MHCPRAAQPAHDCLLSTHFSARNFGSSRTPSEGTHGVGAGVITPRNTMCCFAGASVMGTVLQLMGLLSATPLPLPSPSPSSTAPAAARPSPSARCCSGGGASISDVGGSSSLPPPTCSRSASSFADAAGIDGSGSNASGAGAATDATSTSPKRHASRFKDIALLRHLVVLPQMKLQLLYKSCRFLSCAQLCAYYGAKQACVDCSCELCARLRL